MSGLFAPSVKQDKLPTPDEDLAEVEQMRQQQLRTRARSMIASGSAPTAQRQVTGN